MKFFSVFLALLSVLSTVSAQGNSANAGSNAGGNGNGVGNPPGAGCRRRARELSAASNCCYLRCPPPKGNSPSACFEDCSACEDECCICTEVGDKLECDCDCNESAPTPEPVPPTDSPVPAPTPEIVPVPEPAPVPSPVPTTAPDVGCEVKVTLDCRTSRGESCDKITPPPSYECFEGGDMQVLTFSYQGNTCNPASNSQGSETECVDSAPLTPETEVTIECVDNEDGTSMLVESKDGDDYIFTVTAPGDAVLPEKIFCIVFAAADNTELQAVVIDTGVNAPLNLQDEFGALRIESCGDLTCVEEMGYTVDIENTGTVEMEITLALFTFNGINVDFLPTIPVNPLPPGETTSVDFSQIITVCDAGEISASVQVEATPPSNDVCRDQQEIDFVLTPSPVPAPIPEVFPVPVPAPVPAPQPVPEPTTVAPVPEPTEEVIPRPPPVPVPSPEPVPPPTPPPVKEPTPPVPPPVKEPSEIFPQPVPLPVPVPVPAPLPVPPPVKEPTEIFPQPVPLPVPVPVPAPLPVPPPAKEPVPEPVPMPVSPPVKEPSEIFPRPPPVPVPVPPPVSRPVPMPVPPPVSRPVSEPTPAGKGKGKGKGGSKSKTSKGKGKGKGKGGYYDDDKTDDEVECCGYEEVCEYNGSKSGEECYYVCVDFCDDDEVIPTAPVSPPVRPPVPPPVSPPVRPPVSPPVRPPVAPPASSISDDECCLKYSYECDGGDSKGAGCGYVCVEPCPEFDDAMIVEDDDTPSDVCFPTHSYTDGAGCDCDCECCIADGDDEGDDYIAMEDDDSTDDDSADDDDGYYGKRGGRALKKSAKSGKGKGKGGKGKGKGGKGHHSKSKGKGKGGKGKGKGHHHDTCDVDDVVCSCDCFCPDSGSKSGSKGGSKSDSKGASKGASKSEGSLECCEYEKICPTSGESGPAGKYGRKFRGLGTGDGCEYVCVSYCDGGWRQ